MIDAITKAMRELGWEPEFQLCGGEIEGRRKVGGTEYVLVVYPTLGDAAVVSLCVVGGEVLDEKFVSNPEVISSVIAKMTRYDEQ